MISHFHRSKRNVIIVQDDQNRSFNEKLVVDIWWGGLKGDGSLMIILAYLHKNSIGWQRAQINNKMVVLSEVAAQGARENISGVLSRMRIDITHHVLISHIEKFRDILRRESAGSDLVMMGLAVSDSNFKIYFSKLKEQAPSLPTKAYVLAAQDVEFKEVLT